MLIASCEGGTFCQLVQTVRCNIATTCTRMLKSLILPTDYLKKEIKTIFFICFSFVVSKMFIKVQTVCVIA